MSVIQEAHQYVDFHEFHKDNDAVILGVSLDGSNFMNLIEILFSKGLNNRLTDLRPRLFRAALGLCGDAQQADDLVQVALEKALSGLHRLKQPESLEAWAFTILANCYRDHCRRRNLEEPVQEWPDTGLPDAGEILDAEKKVQQVRRAIGSLNPVHREVLIFVDIEDFSYAEVADILQIPIGTVMSRLKSLLITRTDSSLFRTKKHLERVK